jgi:integrase
VASRRSYGSGSLSVERGSWYGTWRVSGRRVHRKVGPCRGPGTREGLTRVQAEKRLRKMMDADVRPLVPERLTVSDVGERYITHLESLGRARSTLADYRGYVRVQLGPFFDKTSIDRVTSDDVEAFIARKRREGKSPKSIVNWLGFLNSIFAHAQRRGWTHENPCSQVDKPRVDASRMEFLSLPELEAVLTADPERPSKMWSTDRVLYLTAAMTGLRLGELRGLRWRAVDWVAMRLRVGDNYVRGEFKGPKSRRDRSVPLADRVAAELERHFQRSAYQGDDDLVFCHPQTGKPLAESKLRVRFKSALERAGVKKVRFHDLRHTFGTHLMAHPATSQRALLEWIGHADLRTLQRYVHYSPAEDEALTVSAAFAARDIPRDVLRPTGTKTTRVEPPAQAESV